MPNELVLEAFEDYYILYPISENNRDHEISFQLWCYGIMMNFLSIFVKVKETEGGGKVL